MTLVVIAVIALLGVSLILLGSKQKTKRFHVNHKQIKVSIFSNPTDPSDALFFHEDDYCQIEVLPQENFFYLKNECEKINDFGNSHSASGGGYSDVYLRDNAPINLSDKKIDTNQLIDLINQYNIQRAEKITTGYGQSTREELKNTIGFGKNYSALYFESNNQIVNHIWLTNPHQFDIDDLTACLYEIGTKWNLLLVDWNRTEIVDLKDINAINKYLIP